jgi:hypothetical protein
MELSTGRLVEASSRIEEGPFGKSAEERRQRASRRHRQDGRLQPMAISPEDQSLNEEQPESHQLDDLA